MMNRRKWIRRTAYAGVALAALMVAVAIAVPWFARRHLVAILQEQIGGPVEVDRLGLSLRQIEIHGLRLLDAATPPHRWLNVDRAVLDLTLWDALRGNSAPKNVVIDGLVARFSIDESTRLTGDFTPWADGFDFPFDQIDIRNARVEIHTADQPPLRLERIDMKIRGPTEAIRAEGEIVGSQGGIWNVIAKINGRTLETACTLASDELPFSTDMLANLPFVPVDVTDHVQAKGVTSARITLQNTPGQPLHYHVAASPRSLNIVLPKQHLSMTDGQCNVVLEDGLLTVRDFHSTVAGGQLALNGQLNMTGAAWTGKLQGRVDSVALSKLPDKWDLPPEIDGVATGTIDLGLAVVDSSPVLRGHVQAALDQAQILGSDAKSIGLEIDLKQLAFDKQGDPLGVDGRIKLSGEMEQVPLADLLAGLSPDPDREVLDLDGRVDLTVSMTAPLATLSDRSTHQAKGELHSDAITYAGTTLRDVAMGFDYEHGVLSVEPLRAKLGAGGLINAALQIPRLADGQIRADLQCQGLSTQDIAGWLPKGRRPLDAVFSGVIQARVPVEKWGNIADWHADGSVSSPRFQFEDFVASDVASKITLRQGELGLSDFRARWEGVSFRGNGKVGVESPHAYRAAFEVSDLDLPRFAQRMEIVLPLPVQGVAAIKGVAQGNVQPFQWHLEGSGGLANSAIGTVQLDSPTCNWQVTPTQVTLSDARMGLFGGNVEFSARLPLDGRTPGRAEGSFRNLQAASIAALLKTFPLATTGMASGDFSLSGFENPTTMDGTVQFRGLDAVAGSASIQQLGGIAKIGAGRVELELDGKTTGGRLNFRGGAKLASGSDAAMLAGRLTLKSMDASKLVRILKQPSLAPLQAIMDVEMDMTAQGPAFEPKGQGNLILRDVTWRGTRITREVRSRAALTDNTLAIKGISLGLAEGTVTGEAALRLDRPGTGSFQINLQRMRTEDLLAPWDQVAEATRARLDATFHGQFAPGRISAVGEARLSQGHIGAMSVREVSGPVSWIINPTRGSGEVRMRLNRGDLAGGRVSGDVKVKFGRLVGVDGHLKFTGLELRPIAKTVPALNDRLTGRVSGEMSMKGRDLQSLAELSGSYRLSLSDSPALLLPVFNSLADANGIVPETQQFSETEIVGRVHRGVIDIERMTMAASGVHMFIEGTITKRGQLNLDVTADTGALVAVSVAVGLVRPLDLLRRRLIFLHMGGTAQRPVVTPDIDRFVQQEVLLFFLPFVIQ